MEKTNPKIFKLGENYYKECVYYGDNIDNSDKIKIELYYKLQDTENPDLEYISIGSDGRLHIVDYIGIKHNENDDEPALIHYNTDGSVKLEEYCTDGDYHRDTDDPSLIEYINGKEKEVYYYKKGECHRFGKPAYIEYEFIGYILHKGYWEHGRRVTEEESIRNYKLKNRKKLLTDIKKYDSY